MVLAHANQCIRDVPRIERARDLVVSLVAWDLPEAERRLVSAAMSIELV